MKFNIFNGNELIGWSKLETGDPPMGFVTGVFHPNENYREVQPIYRAHFGQAEVPEWVWREIEALDLRAEALNGEAISDHVHFVDATAELANEPIIVDVRCCSAEVYEKHFSHHIKAYDDQFRGENSA